MHYSETKALNIMQESISITKLYCHHIELQAVAIKTDFCSENSVRMLMSFSYEIQVCCELLFDSTLIETNLSHLLNSVEHIIQRHIYSFYVIF